MELTEEVLGRGGWGEVKVATFRGLRVAAKFLFDVILSDYNCQRFTREMMIAAKVRHPNLLLFIAIIGATREGEADYNYRESSVKIFHGFVRCLL